MSVSVVKAIILITILCNDGKQAKKQKKEVKNMELGVKKKAHNSENDKKCLSVKLVTFKSQKGHLHPSQRLNEIFCKEMHSKWHLYY